MDHSQSTNRKYFLGANWKCNGTTAFVKDIITHMINGFQFDPSKLGRYSSAFLQSFFKNVYRTYDLTWDDALVISQGYAQGTHNSWSSKH